VYKAILKRAMELIVQELIVTGNEINLPSRVGSLQIIKFKPKRRKKVMDFGTTNKIYGELNKTLPKGKKKIVYHKNRATDGYALKTFWSKKDRANFLNKRRWAFKFTRPNIRPNTYNTWNPEVSLVPYTKKHGIDHFHEI
jgi:hypothetical protein